MAAYLDGEVSPEERRQIAEHLAGCAVCRKDMEAFSATQSELRKAFSSIASEASLPVDAWRQIQAGLDEMPRPSMLFLFRRRKWRIVATIVFAVVIVALIVLWATGVLPGFRG